MTKFAGDSEALNILEDNFEECAGVFRRKDGDYMPTALEIDAVEYLCSEWDYGYDGR